MGLATNIEQYFILTENIALFLILNIKWFFYVETQQKHTSIKTKLKLGGLSPHANYTNRAASAGRRS